MENKKTMILSVVAIATFAILIVGATYAYFQAQTGAGKSTDINVTTYTTDVFTFTTGNDISIYADQSTFASGKGNQTGSTYASALLTANNKTNTATEHYYLYLNIENNTFTYSINENTPEIIMTITDGTGTEVTDITTLTHTSVTDASGATITGYDITNKNGLITLLNNREITTTSSKQERWNITITFVNYDASQNANSGKTMNAKVMIQKEQIKAYISDVCSSNDNLANCLTTLGNNGDLKFTNLYHHDGTLEYGINDGSYRYSGASENVNNFVCFGSSESSCPTDNLYRIIGVFGNQVKLIKYDYANSNLLGTDGGYKSATTPSPSYYKGNMTSVDTYLWKATGVNTWSQAVLNLTNLNTNFITNIGTEWAQKIATATWKVGGNTEENIRAVIPATAYQNEIVNPDPTDSRDNATEYTAKVGLMYVSDYEFASIQGAWNIEGEHFNKETVNWMYMGVNEWTITRKSQSEYTSFMIYDSGPASPRNAFVNFGIRPSFYLTSSITYKSGTGTESDPIVIN